MNGKIVFITGATDGIGKQTAVELAHLGNTILLHGRTQERAAAAIKELESKTGNGHFHAVWGDLGSFRQVRSVAEQALTIAKRIDVLINNAGVFLNKRTLTEDGFESTFAINYLAPFLLTQLLLERIRQSTPARIINVSSNSHQRATLNFSNLQGEKEFSGYNAYALSKLANILFTVELAERLKGAYITVNALHPGVIDTKLLHAGFNMRGGSLEQGAATSVFLASSPSVANVSGKYFVERVDSPMSPLAADKQLRTEFWKLSEKMCGLN
jgi:NAD(P)-dependent dehydrogenase (short-subunit alcohol dehydrogenase family)